MLNIVLDALFQRVKLFIVPLSMELVHIGFGEILVLVANVFGRWYVIDCQWFMRIFENIFHHIVERSRLACSEIVDARLYSWVILK